MEKWKETALIVVGTVFALFGIWEYVSPIDQATVQQVIEIIFAILGAIGVGVGARGKWIAKKSLDGTIVNGLRIGYIGHLNNLGQLDYSKKEESKKGR